jgi:hypothetical protein
VPRPLATASALERVPGRPPFSEMYFSSAMSSHAELRGAEVLKSECPLVSQ